MFHERRSCAFALAIVFLLSGCFKVGPDFHRPESVVSPGWIDAGDERVRNGPTDYREWWKAFNDPVLGRLIERAYRENLTLKIAGIRVLEARAQLGIAIGRIFPQSQQASGSVERIRTSQSADQAVPPFIYSQDQIGLNASWELDFWGRFRRSIESANATWLATVADYDNALVSLTADVANSYIAIRTLEKRIAIARENVEIQKENLKITEARFRFGTVTELDVEQARTVLNNTLGSIPSLETQLRQQENALCVLLGIAPGDLSDLLKGTSEIPVSPPQVIAGIPADLLRRRPDIRSAEYQAAAQSALIGVAKADLYPAFSLNGSFGFLSTNVDRSSSVFGGAGGKSDLADIFKWKSRMFQIGPSFQWNILNYGQITNNVRAQDARFQELLITYQNTVLKAQQDVEDNLAAFLRAQERAGYLTQSTVAARNALDLAVKQYRQGIRDFTTVLVAQQSLLNEQDNLAVALGSISSGLVGVYRSLGGGWEIREGKELVPPGVKEEMAKRTDWGELLAPASYNPPVLTEPKPSIRPPDW
ncbi:MAG: efflux transporter outer membrane subunit [Nitrospirae bacterium]|nr:efflux transporter outer membrane subunit [Nitrospirota bacterium]